jgi:hypothetical protein
MLDKQKESMAKLAAEATKKEDSKARYMHEKEIHKIGRKTRYQIKSVKKSVKDNIISVDTGNQIIMKHVKESNDEIINTAKAFCTKGTTRNMMRQIHQEYSSYDRKFKNSPEIKKVSNWLFKTD